MVVIHEVGSSAIGKYLYDASLFLPIIFFLAVANVAQFLSHDACPWVLQLTQYLFAGSVTVHSLVVWLLSPHVPHVSTMTPSRQQLTTASCSPSGLRQAPEHYSHGVAGE